METKTKVKIGQIYKFSRKLFDGDVFLDCQTDPHSGSSLIAVSVVNSDDTAGVKKLFGAVTNNFFNSYPSPLQATLMEERLAAVNAEVAKKFVGNKAQLFKKASCAVAELQGDVLSVSGIGQVTAYLLRRNKWMNLLGSKTNSARSHELFGDFTTGKLLPGDSVVVCSSSLFSYLSLDTLKKILSHSQGTEASVNIVDMVKHIVPRDQPVIGAVISFCQETADNPITIRRKTSWRKFRFPALVTSGAAILIATTILASQSALDARQQKVGQEQGQKLESVESDLTNAEAAIIYKDYDKARQILSRTQIDLKQIYASQTSPQQEIKWLDLRKRWESLSQVLSDGN